MISNKRTVPFLVLALFGLSVILYYSTIHLFPSFIHAWTQSDRYAIALQFLANGFDIFHPATFNLQTVNGITRVDFPVNEFVVALIMKLCGSTSAFIFRVYTLCFSIAGLVFLYLFVKKISRSEIKAWLTVLFVFFSPVYVYYQAGFIPSIPAIACVFAGYYYFFTYKEEKRSVQLYTAVFFFLSAALMRIPFIVFLFAISLQQGYIYIKERKVGRREALAFISAFILFIAYYFYNVHLARLYGNMFLDNIMPAKSFTELKEILAEMYDHWSLHYFTMWHYILLFILMLVSCLTFYSRRGYKEEDKKYWFQFLIVSLGTFIYFLMMARQYYAHDYYFLDSLFIPFILLLILVIKNLSMESFKEKLIWSVLFGTAVILFFIGNKNTQAERYSTGPWDRVEITRQNFTGTASFLDSLGVPKDAKILVIDAYTTNAPLILMNRKGYTVMGTTHKNIGTAVQWCKWDVVAIQDIYLVSDVIKNYPEITSMLQCIGSTGRVSFYKRNNDLHSRSLKDFLGITPSRILFQYQFSSRDSKTGHAAILNSETEFGITAFVKASELKDTTGLKVLVSADFISGNSLQDLQLVAAMADESKQYFYQNFLLTDYFKPSVRSQKMEFQFVLPAFKGPSDELKVYLWNPGKVSMVYDNWEVLVYK
jgi:hypothetical protein